MGGSRYILDESARASCWEVCQKAEKARPGHPDLAKLTPPVSLSFFSKRRGGAVRCVSSGGRQESCGDGGVRPWRPHGRFQASRSRRQMKDQKKKNLAWPVVGQLGAGLAGDGAGQEKKGRAWIGGYGGGGRPRQSHGSGIGMMVMDDSCGRIGRGEEGGVRMDPWVPPERIGSRQFHHPSNRTCT